VVQTHIEDARATAPFELVGEPRSAPTRLVASTFARMRGTEGMQHLRPRKRGRAGSARAVAMVSMVGSTSAGRRVTATV